MKVIVRLQVAHAHDDLMGLAQSGATKLCRGNWGILTADVHHGELQLMLLGTGMLDAAAGVHEAIKAADRELGRLLREYDNWVVRRLEIDVYS